MVIYHIIHEEVEVFLAYLVDLSLGIGFCDKSGDEFMAGLGNISTGIGEVVILVGNMMLVSEEDRQVQEMRDAMHTFSNGELTPS